MTETERMIVTWAPAAGAEPQSSLARDVAPGGLFLETLEPIVTGVLCALTMKAGDTKVTVPARVVFVRDRNVSADEPAGMAMRFLDVPPGTSRALATIIEHYRASSPAGDAPYRAELEAAPIESADALQLKSVKLAVAEATSPSAPPPPAPAAMPASAPPPPFAASAVDASVPPPPLPKPAPDPSVNARRQAIALVVLIVLGFVAAVFAQKAM